MALKSASTSSRLAGNIAATQGPSRFPRLSHSRRRLAHLRDCDETGSKRRSARAHPSDSGSTHVPSAFLLLRFLVLLILLLLRLVAFALFPAFRHFFHITLSRRTPPFHSRPEREVTERNITLHRSLTIISRRRTLALYVSTFERMTDGRRSRSYVDRVEVALNGLLECLSGTNKSCVIRIAKIAEIGALERKMNNS